MGIWALAFLGGVLLLQPLPELPDARLAWPIVVLMLVFLSVRRLRVAGVVLVGLLWAWWRADLVLSRELPSQMEGKDLEAHGVIASLPDQRELSERFVFDIQGLTHDGRAYPSPGRVRLSWYGHPPRLNVGDHWRLMVRLKRPRGFMNPGGFDYEGWLFQQRLRATGYVLDRGENRLLASDPWSRPIDRLRQHVSDSIANILTGRPFAGIVVALATGHSQGIPRAHWEVFRETGTVHLMAISGMHITLVGMVVFFLSRRLWAWPGTVVLRWPAPKMAAVSALVAAACYAALSGFSIPTQRALLMLGVVMVALLLQRYARPGRVLGLALILVLLLDPLGVLSAGFWLSFATVALILYGMRGRLAVHGTWWRWGRVHWVVALGLLPLTLFLFQRNPWVGPLANAIAVPWVEMLVVPLTLLGSLFLVFSDSVGAGVLIIAERVMAGLWPLLEALAGWHFVQWAPVGWTLFPALIGTGWLLAPQGFPGRWLGIVWLLPLLWLRPPGPGPGELWLTLLDVGQGLAVVVHTQHHTLVYDTGPRFSSEFDAGDAAVVPFLRASGIRAVDRLVVSHPGKDHAGGLQSILDQVPVRQVLWGGLGRGLGRADGVQRCLQGQRWYWDEVAFEVLHPPDDKLFTGNDGSCVVRVASPAGSLLLTGDIERRGEQRLVRGAGDLQSLILVAPHHGSKSSSGEALVAAVKPRFVLFPVGYRNRFGFPRPEVVERYRARGSTLLDTARHGAITFRLGTDGPRFDTFRQSGRHYWHTR